MKNLVFILTASALLMAGCAAPQPKNPGYAAISNEPQSAAVLQSDAQALRSSLVKRRAELKVAVLQAEIDQLNEEITALEVRLADAERKIAALSLSSGAMTGTGAVHAGPRGGQYTISPSGKKNYIRRK